MTHRRILIHRVVSNDGRTVAEAQSASNTPNESTYTTQQVTVRASSNGSYSSSSASSTSSSAGQSQASR